MTRTLLKSLLVGIAIYTQIPYASAGALPPPAPSFGASIAGLYLKPGSTNLIYAVETEPLPLPAPSWAQKLLKPDFHGAFDLALFYIFANQENSIKLNWLHFDGNDSTRAISSGTKSIAPQYYFGPLAQPISLRNTAATNRADFKVDNINLVSSHLFNLGKLIQVKPFAGIGTAYLKQNLTTTYTGVDLNSGVPYSNTVYNESKFSSIGPRLGLEMIGMMNEHFSIVAEMASSLLVGSMKTKTNFLTQGNSHPTPITSGLADISDTRIVPQVDSKIALSYQTNVGSSSVLALQIGYLYSVYFNGINQVLPTELVPNSFNNGFFALVSSTQTQSNLDLSGPYIKVTLLSNS